MNLPLIDLYETDFYAWTQEQVELLRQNQLDHLDIKNLIEEIESLGKQQQQELVNRLGILLGHLLKWEYQDSKRSKSWIKTIREQRRKIKKLIQKNPSLKSFLDEAIEEAYVDGVELAVDETDIEIQNFPSQVPYTWEQIENQDFLPGFLTDSDKDLLKLWDWNLKSPES
jgi:NAD dependent epimerase/dehydratase family enzyme